ncbi:hypothetical protein [Lentzea sp. NPDC092896]|uniref:hypothetical protein n=1 Tax=Lentzea sp. NPDC092896 TaxID=3364127 RepID=UPI0037FA70F4
METGDNGEALPERKPFPQAARSPIGTRTPTNAKKYLDSLVIVIAPLFFPAVVLGITRTGPNHDVLVGFTLVDVAFGIAAVAFAALAKSVADGHDNWKLVGIVAVVAMALETALAVKGDNMPATEKLAADVAQCVNACNLGKLNEMAIEIQQNDPLTLHWVVALSTGALLCAMAFAAIWKES